MASSLPPNTFEGAIYLGALGTVDSATHRFPTVEIDSQTLTTSSPFDTTYYSFSAPTSRFFLESGLYEAPGGSVYLTLYNSNRVEVASNRAGNETFGPFLQYTSEANKSADGQYYLRAIKVGQANVPSARYGFGLTVVPYPENGDLAGTTTTAARDMGSFSSGRRNFSVSDNFYTAYSRSYNYDGLQADLVTTNHKFSADDTDFHAFTLNQPGAVTISVSGSIGGLILRGPAQGNIGLPVAINVAPGQSIKLAAGKYVIEAVDAATTAYASGAGSSISFRQDWEVFETYQVSLNFKPTVPVGRSFNGGVSNEKFNLSGQGAAVEIVGGAGNDLVWGAAKKDLLSGGLGRDILIGGPGADTLHGDDPTDPGRGDKDQLLGGRGGDTAFGGAGNDYINGEWENDVLFGEDGNDLIYGGFGADRLFGGEGNDQLWGASAAAPNGRWFGPAIVLRADGVTGRGIGSEAWTVAGELQAGDTGKDYLDGGAGADRLWGGLGNDILVGGLGTDRLDGGAGRDVFRFGDVVDSLPSAPDKVTRFQRGLDKIDLLSIDARQTSGGNESFSFVGAQAFSGASGELRFSAGLIEGDVNGDQVADFAIRMAGIKSMAASDFLL